jgi:hypothetical protein
MVSRKPFANTRLSQFLIKRIIELRPLKTQSNIASEAGFVNVNMLAMIKVGANRLPLDRVSGLAKALDVDARFLWRVAVEQDPDQTIANAAADIFGTVVSKNEVGWLEAIREASGDTDPPITRRARRAMLEVFGK